MRTNPRKTCAAMALGEILAIVGVALVLLAVFLLPILARTRARSSRITCVSNLKHIGLAFRMWGNDHNDTYPFAVSTNDGGTLPFVDSGNAFPHFAAISNELNSPKVLVCEKDTARSKVTDWAKLNDRRLSYFVGLEANEYLPQTILSGDRNIQGGANSPGGLTLFASNSPATWGRDLHRNHGHLLLGDGSAQQTDTNILRRQIQAALASTNVPALRFAIPKPN